MKVTTKLIGLMCLAAAGYLAQAAQAEWKVVQIFWSKPKMSVAVLHNTQLDTKYSYNISREVLTRCLTTISSGYFEGLTDAEKSRIGLNCHNFAQGLVKKISPTRRRTSSSPISGRTRKT